MKRALVLLLALSPLLVLASPWPIEVVSVQYGPGAGFGQNHFPDNVLGPPDENASERVPCADPVELLSLGTGGCIVLYFDDPIVDGEGYDLIVFENAMLVGDSGDTYAECGILSFSSNGSDWVEYPFDTESLSGLAGVTPTCGSCDPLDPAVSGGDPFDLEFVGLSQASYVRICDAADRVSDDGSSFDLDALAALHQQSTAVIPPEAAPYGELVLGPNPCQSVLQLQLEANRSWEVEVFDLRGRCITRLRACDRAASVDLGALGLASGSYLVRAKSTQETRQTKVLYLP